MSADSQVKLPMHASGKRSTFFEQEAIDHLVTMTIELASQLWVTRERLFALELVLGKGDSSLAERIEGWEPSAQEQEALEAKRRHMLADIFRTLEIERTGPSDEDVVAKAR